MRALMTAAYVWILNFQKPTSTLHPQPGQSVFWPLKWIVFRSLGGMAGRVSDMARRIQIWLYTCHGSYAHAYPVVDKWAWFRLGK